MPALPVGISQPAQFGQQSITINSRDPAEPPEVFNFKFDFTAAASYSIDMTMEIQQGRLSGVQTLYADNSGNNQPLTVSVQGTGQPITIAPGAQSYVPVLSPQPCRFTFSSSGSVARNVYVALLNVPMPFSVWYPNEAHSNGGAAYTASNINATTAAFQLAAGSYGIDYIASVWGTVTLQKQAGDGSTWVDARSAWSANGSDVAYLPAGTYRLELAGASGVYVQIGVYAS